MKAAQLLKGFAVLLLLWYLIALILQSPVVPFAHTVFFRLLTLLGEKTILIHGLSSFFRIAAAIFMAMVTGIAAGVLAGKHEALENIISPVLYILYPIPKIALLPVFLVLLGIGELSKIALITVILFFPIAISVRDSVDAVSRQYLQLAQSLRLSGYQVLKEIILPGILPGVFSVLRVSVGISLSVLFFSENFATRFGLGHFIMNAWIMADYVEMYAGIIVLSTMGVLLYTGIDLAEKKLLPWTAWI
jgi:ABC-type nitrate/sulfonate/bicarbonate transport system permease component